ncbi:tumor necrosis factor ligand superfamily member 11 [Discoglossus pictus]
MSPSGYLRGAAELGGAPGDRPQSVPRSVLLALIFLAVAQVSCTVGLFLYFKAQMVPNWMSEKQLQCWIKMMKMRETSEGNDSLPDDKDTLNLCKDVDQAFHMAVKKEAYKMVTEKPSQRPAIIEPSHSPRKTSRQTASIAHLPIADHKLSHGKQSKANITSWNYKEGWGNLLNMGYNDGRLKILQDGFYYVYANVCFRHHEVIERAVQDKFLQLMLYICKIKSNGTSSETLMKGGSTANWSNDSEYHFHSFYKGAVFKLMAGDELYVQVSHPELLDLAQEATYFGAVKILDQSV